MESLNNYPFTVKDKSIEIFHDYLKNNYFNNFLAIILIFAFAILFNFVYLAVDSFIVDKKQHYQLAVKAYMRYEYKKKINKTESSSEENSDKDELLKRSRKIEFTSWMYRNLQISLIHSVLCSLWLIKIFILDGNNELTTDLLFYVSWDTYVLLAFSSGYFLYDFYDICSNGRAKREWAVCLHHWTVLVSFGYHMIYLVNIGYSVIALLMEFNSICLHTRKLLKFYLFKQDSIAVRLNSALNFLTFVTFRFGVLIAIVHGMITQGHRVTFNYLVLLGTCTFIMFIINLLLFKQLYRKDWSGFLKIKFS